MKPNDANTEYCIKYTEYVNGLRARRGGWQDGDWVFLNGKPKLIRRVRGSDCASRVRGSDYAIYTLIDSAWYKLEVGYVWLPSEGDVLGMLEAEGVDPVLISVRMDSSVGSWLMWCAMDAVLMVPERDDCHKTPLIALLELLKAVEAK